MTKKLLEIAADIVHAQVSASSMGSEEIVSSLRQIFGTLQEIQKSEVDGTAMTSAKSTEEIASEANAEESINPLDSIKNDTIVCLECGAEMRQITARHLSLHDLSPKEYKKKYGFRLSQPLSAKALTRARSKAAKKRGLPASLVKYQEDKRQEKAESALSMSSPEEALFVQDASDVVSTEIESSPKKRGRKKVVA